MGGAHRDKLQDLITALGQIKAAGHVTGEELRQLRNANIPLDLLAKGFGTTAAQFDKFVREGLVPGDAAVRVLVSGMEDRFGKFNDAVGKTATTAVSNFKDALQKLADDAAGQYLPAITKGINDLRDSLKDVSKFVQNNGSEIAQWAGFLTQALVIYKVAQGAIALSTALKALSFAGAANPIGLLAAGATFLGIQVYKNVQALKAQSAAFNDTVAIKAFLANGGHVTRQMEELGYDLEKIKSIMTDRGTFATEGLEQVRKAAAALNAELGITISASSASLDAIDALAKGFRILVAIVTRVHSVSFFFASKYLQPT